MRQWVRSAVTELQPRKDMSSDSFMTKLRHDLRISSRKITRTVAASETRNEEDIVANATAFLLELNDKIASSKLRDGCVWNADQSGFEYEPIRNRTLTFKGEKIVEARVADKNACTHSYTIQVHISKAGTLGKNLFINFQENKKKNKRPGFGPRIRETLDNVLECCKNIKVTCSTSGKFTTTIMQYWFNHIFLQDVSEESMLILDAWSGQGETAELRSHNLSIEYITRGATKYIQPLDVYFFRQYRVVSHSVFGPYLEN